MWLKRLNEFIKYNYSWLITEGAEHPSDVVDKYLKELEDILGGTSIENNISYDSKNTLNTSKQLFFKVLCDEKNRSRLGSFLIDEYKERKYQLSDIPNGQKFGVRFTTKEGLNVLILIKPNGKRSAEMDPNEAMVACLLAMGEFEIPKTDVEMDNLISECSKYKKKIINAPAGVFDFFDKNYTNLIQAVSAADVILKKINGKPEKIYLTGGSYPDDIKFLMLNHLNMKDYNSSDIVLKMKDNYIGISLKKAINENTIPTLLNKSVNNVINLKSELGEIITNATDEFFNSIVEHKFRLKNLKGTDWKKYIAKISNDEVNKELKGNESHFKTIYEEFIKMDETAIMTILSLIFKLDMKKLLKSDFDFYLVTGIGDYGPRKGVQINHGHITELNTIIDLLEKFNKESKISIQKPSNKKQAFEEDATAAKLYFDIVSGTTPIVHLEIRYKGSFTSQPQIFAFLSKEFKKLMQG